MNIKNKKWLLLISIPAIIGIFFIIFFSVSETTTHRAPWGHAGCPHMTPNYILWASVLLLIFAIVPISYYLISQKLGEKLEKNMKVISKLINKNNQTPKKEAKEINNKNVILKFLNPNERKILEKLIENKGTVLQSEISRIEGMTKLKTHRAVKDLERKGIINTESHGKTNRIILTKDIKDIILK
ncbi:MAG: winged helix-turn-helix transcriptional regulator [DPANN group archaeon]|nr:winged helix-turn-helix transcriptional regulator [DPANN group archaeon]